MGRTRQSKIPPAPKKKPPSGNDKEPASDDSQDVLDIEASDTPLSGRKHRRKASSPSPSPEPMSSREAKLLAANEKLQKEMAELRRQMFGDNGGKRRVAVPRRAAAPHRDAPVRRNLKPRLEIPSHR